MVEVYDEVTDVVLVFDSLARAETFALTGQPTWSGTRAPHPADRFVVTLSSVY